MLPRIKGVPRAFPRMLTEDAHWIETTAKFNQAVERGLERMVPACLSVVEMPEVKESEPDADRVGIVFGFLSHSGKVPQRSFPRRGLELFSICWQRPPDTGWRFEEISDQLLAADGSGIGGRIKEIWDFLGAVPSNGAGGPIPYSRGYTFSFSLVAYSLHPRWRSSFLMQGADVCR